MNTIKFEIGEPPSVIFQVPSGRKSEDVINEVLFSCKDGIDTNLISDGYHTFGELYEHRIRLFIALARIISEQTNIKGLYVEKTRKNKEGEEWDGWFILIINTHNGQISYHLPNKYWDECDFEPIEKNDKYDGHTGADVLERLSKL